MPCLSDSSKFHNLFEQLFFAIHDDETKFLLMSSSCSPVPYEFFSQQREKKRDMNNHTSCTNYALTICTSDFLNVILQHSLNFQERVFCLFLTYYVAIYLVNRKKKQWSTTIFIHNIKINTLLCDSGFHFVWLFSSLP